MMSPLYLSRIAQLLPLPPGRYTLQVKAFFTGTVLNVTATAAIAKVSIFDVNGVLLATTAPASEQAQLNTANFSGKFYIVNVILANGNQRNFKLLRK